MHLHLHLPCLAPSLFISWSKLNQAKSSQVLLGSTAIHSTRLNLNLIGLVVTTHHSSTLTPALRLFWSGRTLMHAILIQSNVVIPCVPISSPTIITPNHSFFLSFLFLPLRPQVEAHWGVVLLSSRTSPYVLSFVSAMSISHTHTQSLSSESSRTAATQHVSIYLYRQVLDLDVV